MRRPRPELDLHKSKKALGFLECCERRRHRTWSLGYQSLREAEGQQELPVFEQKFYSRGNRNLVHQTSGIIILTKVVGRNRNFVI